MTPDRVFETLPEVEALQMHPGLAPAYDFIRAVETKTMADGLNEEQRRIVLSRVHTKVVERIEAGALSSDKVQDEKQSISKQELDLER